MAQDYRIIVISLPNSQKRKSIQKMLGDRNLDFEFSDGVWINSIDDINYFEMSDLEGYNIERLKTDPDYCCRTVGCKRAMINALGKAKENDCWTVILEDDVILHKNFDSEFIKILNIINDVRIDAVMLFWAGDGFRNEDGYLFVSGCIKSCSAFAVSPDFAHKYYEQLKIANNECDLQWNTLSQTGSRIFLSLPKLAYTNQKGSDIISGIEELRYRWG